ncbi:hypothetical protein AB0I49_08385 [Streptomyces sp. NPDC050617]|uniref:hypothetical protein n=1 Tax=Streptomyces sp. NPDC050617 TaxID=3154628 RepID=UPI00341E24BD
MRSASELLDWNCPFDPDALPRDGVERLPAPGAGVLERIEVLSSFEGTAHQSPVHLRLLGIAQFLAGQPFLAIRTLLSVLAQDPGLSAAQVDLATVFAHTERIDMAMTCLIQVIDSTTAKAMRGPAAARTPDKFRFLPGTPQAAETTGRYYAANDLVRRRKDELSFLLLRTAEDAEARSRSRYLRAEEVLRHTTALIALGELTEVVHPFDQAAELLTPNLSFLDGAELEQLARIRIAAGPTSARDEVLGRLQKTAPQSRVLRDHHRPSMLERRLQEQDARFEAQLLAREAMNGVQGWTSLRRPIDHLVLRARASDHPEPYRAALVQAQAVPGGGDHHS